MRYHQAQFTGRRVVQFFGDLRRQSLAGGGGGQPTAAGQTATHNNASGQCVLRGLFEAAFRCILAHF